MIKNRNLTITVSLHQTNHKEIIDFLKQEDEQGSNISEIVRQSINLYKNNRSKPNQSTEQATK